MTCSSPKHSKLTRQSIVMLWTNRCFCHLLSCCPPPPTWPSASRSTIVCRLTRLKRSPFLGEKKLRPRIWFMQNCYKLNKKGSRCLLEWPEILHSLNDFVKTNNEMLFLDYGPGSRQCCAFSRLLPWPPSFTDIPDLLYLLLSWGEEWRLIPPKNEICPSELGLALTSRIWMKVLET